MCISTPDIPPPPPPPAPPPPAPLPPKSVCVLLPELARKPVLNYAELAHDHCEFRCPVLAAVLA